MDFIKMEGLVKRYGNNLAVNNVSLEIEKGELFGLLGPNGAGKSTTISMICGLVKENEGNITIGGVNVFKDTMSAKKMIGLVPQEIALYPTLTAKENLMFWGKMYGLKGKLLKERVSEALDIVGLQDRKNDKIESFSGGMKRRINIAAALLHRPEILIMDEPTVGIDPQSRNHILETVKKLNRTGMTIIYTSHYMEEVEYLCTRIGIMDKGKVIAIGDKEGLRRSVITEDRIEASVSAVTPTLLERLKSIPDIAEVRNEDNNLVMLSNDGSEMVVKVINIISDLGINIHSIKIDEPNLESVFLKLTGRALRD